MTVVPPLETVRRTPAQACAVGTLIGMLGGLIGLGGAEFRLPVLVGWFRFPTLEAVILNKVTSLVVVTFALLFRSFAIPWREVLDNWSVIANVLAGSLAGAWMGAHYATRISQQVLNTTILVLLVGLAIGMIAGHAGGVFALQPKQRIRRLPSREEFLAVNTGRVGCWRSPRRSTAWLRVA